MVASFLEMHSEITELSNASNLEQVKKINLEYIDISVLKVLIILLGFSTRPRYHFLI